MFFTCFCDLSSWDASNTVCQREMFWLFTKRCLDGSYNLAQSTGERTSDWANTSYLTFMITWLRRKFGSTLPNPSEDSKMLCLSIILTTVQICFSVEVKAPYGTEKSVKEEEKVSCLSAFFPELSNNHRNHDGGDCSC